LRQHGLDPADVERRRAAAEARLERAHELYISGAIDKAKLQAEALYLKQVSAILIMVE